MTQRQIVPLHHQNRRTRTSGSITLIITFILAGMLSHQAHSAIVMNMLSGNKEYDGWNSLTSTTPGLTTTILSTGQGFGSNEAGSGNANLLRTSGGHYPASQSLYSFGSHSTFQVSDASALSDVNTVVFTILTWGNPDFGTGPNPSSSLNSAPILNYNGGTQALVADYFGATSVGSVDFGGPIPTFAYTYQWNLSSVGDTVSAYDIDWGQIIHTGVIGIQVESSDLFSVSAAVAPEPSRAILVLAGLGGLLMRRRRSKRL